MTDAVRPDDLTKSGAARAEGAVSPGSLVQVETANANAVGKSVDVIWLKDVTVKRDGVTILDRVTASVPARSVTAIIGPNGAGKTTLLHAILGLIPAEGMIELRGLDGNRRPRIGYVPQRLDFDRGVPITVLDFLIMGHQRLPVWFGARKYARDRAMESLKRVRADHLVARPLGRLSGGELQRVQLALALQSEPEIVLLDEPVSGVDIIGEQLFCDMLENVQLESHFTLVMVSHDLSVVSRHASHVICINRVVHCQGPAPEMLTAENIASIYGPHAGLVDHPDVACASHPHGHAHPHAAPPPSVGQRK